MQNIMLDLETMSLHPEAAIVAIGAVKFNHIEITSRFYRTVSLQSAMSNKGEVDASTILWWMQQKEEARKEIIEATNKLPFVLYEFTNWCQAGQDPLTPITPEEITMWGNGSDFDCIILASAYRNCGALTFRPWSQWNYRCYRTIKNNCLVECDPFVKRHNALEDAERQALHLIKIANQYKLPLL